MKVEDDATSHLKNALQVSVLLANRIGDTDLDDLTDEQRDEIRASLTAIDERIRAALAQIKAADVVLASVADFPRFVDSEPHKRQYPEQHPAEATLDYIASVLRDHTRGHGEQ